MRIKHLTPALSKGEGVAQMQKPTIFLREPGDFFAVFAFKIFAFLFLFFSYLIGSAQIKDLGEQRYEVIKDYIPVLAESFKISDAPGKDTSSSTAPELKYSISSHAATTSLELSPVKPVKIKDESISKL